MNSFINLHEKILIQFFQLTIKFSMTSTSTNIQAILKTILDQQLQHERTGKYVEAEECRLKYEKQKEDHQNSTIYEMNMRHKKEQEDMNRARKNELDSFNNFWETQMGKFEKDSQKMIKDLQSKHDEDYKKTRQQLDRTLPIKVKESSELLNLRKMEEHMAKQKNYPEAHRIQEKIAAYLKNENQQWHNNRNIKMETALTTLKNKQKNQMTNLQKRVATSRAERKLDRTKEEEKINLKYENFMKDLKNAQEKQMLAFKGQFTSFVGSGKASSPAKTRSSFGSNLGSTS